MSVILVLIDHAGGKLCRTGLELLTLARSLGEPTAVFLGPGYDRAQSESPGTARRRCTSTSQPEFTEYAVVPHVDALAQVAASTAPAAVLIPSSAEGKEIAGRLAVRHGWGLLVDALDVRLAEDRLEATQSVFGGTHSVASSVTGGTPIVTVKPGAITAEPAPSRPRSTGSRPHSPTTPGQCSVIESSPRTVSGRPDLAEAKIIISGGRGTGGELLPHRGARRRAGSRSWRLTRRRRRRLLSPFAADRPDRQNRLSAALPRLRYLRSDPAPRRHADLEDDCRRQQRPGGADLRHRRLRRCRRPVHVVPKLTDAIQQRRATG